jgi:hypothetical protein
VTDTLLGLAIAATYIAAIEILERHFNRQARRKAGDR